LPNIFSNKQIKIKDKSSWKGREKS
jgi:hypothetical protein